MPGPPPNKFARRRNKRPDWVTLPASGYDGPVPSWPLSEPPDDDERELWLSLWRSPQAVMWAKSGFERVVARYVVASVLCEDKDRMNGALLNAVKDLEDRLGLSPMAFKRLQWELSDDDVVDDGDLAEVTRIDRFAGL